MNDRREHERYIWNGPNHEHLYPIETDGKPYRAICVIGPDTIHPKLGFSWWQSLRQKDLEIAQAARDAIVDQTYSDIKGSMLTLADAIEYADNVHPFRCLGICRSLEDICKLFDYWISLGSCPYGQSDSDIFALSDAIVTTYSPAYSDIWTKTGGDG